MRSCIFLLICVPSLLALSGCVENAPPGLDAAKGVADPDGFSEFKTYVGKDLRELDSDEIEMQNLLTAIKRLVPNREYEIHFDYFPWRIWEFAKDGGEPSYLLFEANNMDGHPGTTPIRLTVFSNSGAVLSETQFTTAHRCYLHDVELQVGVSGYPFVVLKTGNGPGPGPCIEQQYYAIIGDRFDLVRLETSKGKIARNDYSPIHFRAGPAPPLRTEAEWESDLLSEDRLIILRALVWLGGVHWDLKEGDELRPDREEPGQIWLVRQVRQNPTVNARLRELSQSKDPWVSEAASLALDPQDTHW